MSAITGNDDIEHQLERVFENSEDPALNAVEVAEELGISQQAAHSKLMKEYENNNVGRKKVGSRAVVWWLKN